jgi:hypothetical protein
MMGPLADILLLDFGLRSLRLSNCGLEDEVRSLKKWWV